MTKTIQEKIDKFIFAQFFESANTRDKARLLSAGNALASRWVTAPPQPVFGLHMEPQYFRITSRRLLGISVLPSSIHCLGCRKPKQDPFGDHAVICSQYSDVIRRHNDIRDTIFKATEAAQLCSKKEARNLLIEGNKKPADVFIEDWSKGQSACLDVTVVTPLRKDIITQAAEKPGVAAEKAEASKDRKFLKDCEDLKLLFVPLAFESFGRWGSFAIEELSKLSRRIAEVQDRKSSNVFLQLSQQIAVALQRGNSRCIHERRKAQSVAGWDQPAH